MKRIAVFAVANILGQMHSMLEQAKSNRMRMSQTQLANINSKKRFDAKPETKTNLTRKRPSAVASEVSRRHTHTEMGHKGPFWRPNSDSESKILKLTASALQSQPHSSLTCACCLDSNSNSDYNHFLNKSRAGQPISWPGQLSFD